MGRGPRRLKKRIYRTTRERTSKCTNTLYDYAIIINTYVSLMHELKKNWKDTDEYICWDGALVLWKKNLPGRGLTKVEKR